MILCCIFCRLQRADKKFSRSTTAENVHIPLRSTGSPGNREAPDDTEDLNDLNLNDLNVPDKKFSRSTTAENVHISLTGSPDNREVPEDTDDLSDLNLNDLNNPEESLDTETTYV